MKTKDLHNENIYRKRKPRESSTYRKNVLKKMLHRIFFLAAVFVLSIRALKVLHQQKDKSSQIKNEMRDNSDETSTKKSRVFFNMKKILR
jgi:hypothetical protein